MESSSVVKKSVRTGQGKKLLQVVRLSNGKMGGLELEEYVPEVFSGELRDYAYWKGVWNHMVHSRADLADELYLLGQCVPVDAQRELRMCEDLDSAWSFLDQEYGNTRKLSAQRVSDLRRFKYSEETSTDGDKLLELREAWRGVYLDLRKVGVEGDLNVEYILVEFVNKFPEKFRDGFVRFLCDASNEGLDDSVVLDEFLARERRVVRRLKEYEELRQESVVNTEQESVVDDQEEQEFLPEEHPSWVEEFVVDEERSVVDAQDESVVDAQDESVVVAQEEEKVKLLRTEEDLKLYLEDVSFRRRQGLPKQPFLNLIIPEDEGSSPTDSSTSSPVRVAESPGRGSAAKSKKLKIVDKEYSKVEAVLEVRKVFGSPSNVDVSGRDAVARKRSAPTVSKPAKRKVPKGKKLPKKKKRPIYSGTWRARKPSEAEEEVEAILKRFGEIRKETELVVARPRKTAAKVKDVEVKTVGKVMPKLGKVEVVVESDSGISDMEGSCKERDSVECAGLSANLKYNCTEECGCEFSEEEEMEDWLEELGERLGLGQEDSYLLQVRRPQVTTQSSQKRRIKSGKVKTADVVSNIESVQSTVEKVVKETEEPEGAKVKASKVKEKKKKVRPDAESSQREETKVQGGEDSLCNAKAEASRGPYSKNSAEYCGQSSCLYNGGEFGLHCRQGSGKLPCRKVCV